MRINSVTTKPVFKAQLSPEIRKGMLRTAENIVSTHGENSKQYRNYANNIRRCLDYSPKVKVYTSYNPKFHQYYYTLEENDKEICTGMAIDKEDLYNAENVHALACEILLISLRKKLNAEKTVN